MRKSLLRPLAVLFWVMFAGCASQPSLPTPVLSSAQPMVSAVPSLMFEPFPLPTQELPASEHGGVQSPGEVQVYAPFVAQQTPHTQMSTGLYDPGTPALREVWVDPLRGDDANDGTTPTNALRTLAAAWQSIPMNVPLTQGVRINLQPGIYLENALPNYWEARQGTFAAPIWIRGSGEERGEVVLQGYVNIFDTDYIYFENLTVRFKGDVFHCERCNHVLIRNVSFDGEGAAQETVKVNQSQHIYVESSHLSGAWDNVVDFVAVQYGHLFHNQIHGGGDWCAYVKGGSAYIRVEANVIYDCGTGGFTAGQGTGFQFMIPPWLQYEAYDVKVLNNLIHDTEGAGLGVNGGYNILLAYNTLVRVGTRSHVLEVVFGGRSCDGQPGELGRERCQEYLDQGGWGTTEVDNGSNFISIPNKNVYIYNNLVYNPPGYQSMWQHFAIYDSRVNPASSNIPFARADDNLQIRGNVIWNGDVSMSLGIEGNNDACTSENIACNETQLRADNAINALQPILVNAAANDFHPVGDWVQSATLFEIPDFIWELSVPAGENSNLVLFDRDGVSRSGRDTPGAYALLSR
ncbi:MAG: right-handed parallel beta-helix repeat-containing protein [Caldilinea sp.]|nr:right-handed parallel beta-helix repeat-containing protein [Caldilinea sp.]MDW8440203.1 right-handed parallel beta-helix repeat-containing protein [Caldilineaceae bacterium]